MAKAEAFKTLPTTPFASDIPAAQIAKNLGIVTPEWFESYKETANFNTYLQDVSTGKDAYENINITTGIYEVDNDPYFSWYSTHTGLNDLYSQGEVWATGTPISGSGGLENLALNDVKTYLDLGLDDDIWLNGVQVQTSNLTAEQKTLAQETAKSYSDSWTEWKEAEAWRMFAARALHTPAAHFPSPSNSGRGW